MNISRGGKYRYWLERGGKYRYWLERGEDPKLVWCMLNPSTADVTTDDPTVRRCLGFAERAGYRGIIVVNLFALRTPDPRMLRHLGERVGPRNDEALMYAWAYCMDGYPIVMAWGTWGDKFPARVERVKRLLKGAQWLCCGVTRSGQPKHPLMQPYRKLQPFNG